jgi:hypothetical protein
MLDRYKYKIAIETGRGKDIDSRLPAACQEKSLPLNAERRDSELGSDAKTAFARFNHVNGPAVNSFTPNRLIFSKLL